MVNSECCNRKWRRKGGYGYSFKKDENGNIIPSYGGSVTVII
jgi:hypothetical protein